MTEAPILRLVALEKSFGALKVTNRVSLDVGRNEIHALIGPNGAGKTTLIGEITGEIRPDAGTILFAGADITALPVHARALKGLARSFQITQVLPSFSALENVAIAAQAHAGSSLRFIGGARGEAALNARAEQVLATIGLLDRAEVPARLLSHGEKRQLEIAMCLAAEPRLLLLDEPMAGMGREESERMIEVLSALKGRWPMLLVEHDMHAVFRLADRISVLVDGRIIASGAPEAVRRDSAVREAYLGTEELA